MSKSFLMKKGVPLLSVAFVSLMAMATASYSQIEKSLAFIPEKVDFGLIREENGLVTHKVKAVNITEDTTYIISARTSCGCSAAEYPNDQIAPGDTVEVYITYDPTNRPGKFLKTARFFTGTDRIGNSIKLSGTVIPSSENLDKAYPEKAGPLRLSSLIITAGDLSRKEARPLFVGLYNDSNKPLALSALTNANALEAGLVPDTIEPFGISTLTLMLKGRNIPSNETEILYKAYLVNPSTSDTIISIPVIGMINDRK
ncbi:MAG: DUF1573 domain-containing protein [Muribaculaceae bacterium]|nr:DUF1573 domain-containing protein [Muribaculaceae bacterium]